MQTLRIQVLGKLAIVVGGQPADLTINKAKALLIYLALTEKPHSRSHLAGLFWPDKPEIRAKGNLRVLLTKIKQACGDCIIATRQTVAFDALTSHTIDTKRFETLLTSGDLQEGIELYQGVFLADFVLKDAPEFEQWVLVQRQRYQQMVQEGLHRRMIEAEEKRAFVEGIAAARKLLTFEPWDEEGHYQLIYLLALSGQRSAALAQYQTCIDILEEELGIEPPEKIAELVEEIEADRIHPPDPNLIMGRYRLGEPELTKRWGAIKIRPYERMAQSDPPCRHGRLLCECPSP